MKEKWSEIEDFYTEKYIEKLNTKFGFIVKKVDGGVYFINEDLVVENFIVLNYLIGEGLSVFELLKKMDSYDFEFLFDKNKMKFDCENDLMKVGNKYNKCILGLGKKIGYCKIGKYYKGVIGENLKIVEKTFKNLKNDWFKDWKFEVVDRLYFNHFNIPNNKNKDRRYDDDIVNVDFGKFLEISNDKIGRILLGEYDENRYGDKYEFKVVVKSIERYSGGIKGKMGSVLTILNRVCKGNDILIEIEVGSLNDTEIIRSGEIEFNQNKLERWYEKRGFEISSLKSLKYGMRVMDSREVLEEYCERMGWNDE